MNNRGLNSSALLYRSRLSRLRSSGYPSRSIFALPCSSTSTNSLNGSGTGSNTLCNCSSTTSPKAVSIDNAAFRFEWQSCTIRGYPDGGLVYKFGSTDPPSDVSISGTPLSSPWSNALRLGVKYSDQIQITLSKLDKYVREYEAGKPLHPRQELKYGLHKTYAQAARARSMERRQKGEVDQSAESSSSGDDERIVDSKDNLKKKHENAKRNKKEAGKKSVVPAKVLPSPLKGAASTGAVAGVGNDTTENVEAPPTSQQHPEQKKSPPIDTLLDAGTPESVSERSVLIFGKTALLVPSISQLWRRCFAVFFVLYEFALQTLRRALLQRSREWPPIVHGHHVSPTISRMLGHGDAMSRDSLASVGFDSQGRSDAPLRDLPVQYVERLVGCKVRDISLYQSAFTHPTALQADMRHHSYQRLEYLGDSVVELCTRELLMERTPDAEEGELTMQAQSLVAGHQVNAYAVWLGLDRWVVANAYSMRVREGLRGSPYVLGDAFEALIGAIYLDRGLECARAFLLRVLEACPAVEWGDIKAAKDYKGMLSRASCLRRSPRPSYHVQRSRNMMYKNTGMKRKYWTVEVRFEGKVAGIGTGWEKRSAEQSAARLALRKLGELQD